MNARRSRCSLSSSCCSHRYPPRCRGRPGSPCGCLPADRRCRRAAGPRCRGVTRQGQAHPRRRHPAEQGDRRGRSSAEVITALSASYRSRSSRRAPARRAGTACPRTGRIVRDADALDDPEPAGEIAVDGIAVADELPAAAGAGSQDASAAQVEDEGACSRSGATRLPLSPADLLLPDRGVELGHQEPELLGPTRRTGRASRGTVGGQRHRLFDRRVGGRSGSISSTAADRAAPVPRADVEPDQHQRRDDEIGARNSSRWTSRSPVPQLTAARPAPRKRRVTAAKSSPSRASPI